MKRLALASVLISMGAFGACAVEEPAATNNEGFAGTGPAAGSPANGGSAGSGVQGGSAGVGVQGGTAGSSTGGSVATGGTAGTGIGGTAGDMGMGGMLLGGQGGTAGDMGMGMGGMLLGGMGGTAGDMGMGMGGMGMGGMGMGGMGMGGMTPMCPTPAQLFPAAGSIPSLEGRLLETPCSPTNSDDCTGGGWRVNGGTMTGCMSNRLNSDQVYMVGGTPGENYRVTFRFFGIVEPKNYGGNVTRQAGNTRPTNNNDTSCQGTGDAQVCGANPPPWAYRNGVAAGCQPGSCYTASDYNTYEIHVRNQMGQETCSYFLNSDTQEGHWTYSLNYARTINVIGGGSIRVRAYDQNCRMIKNCYNGGQGSANECATRARTVNVSGASPMPTFSQPGLGQDSAHSGQWLLIDATNVQCGQPQLACNGMPM